MDPDMIRLSAEKKRKDFNMRSEPSPDKKLKGPTMAISQMNFMANGQQKIYRKLIIKPFKVKPVLPENYESETWKKLAASVLAIQQKQRVPDSLEDLYKHCENLCHYKKQEPMAIKLKELCTLHMSRELAQLKLSIQSSSNVLQLVNDCWTNHCRQMIMIRNIFLYLDRTYLLQNAALKSLWEMGLELFRDVIIGDHDVSKKTIDMLLDQINQERYFIFNDCDGNLVSKNLIGSTTRMLLDLSVYLAKFENPFLESTTLYYTRQSASMIEEIVSNSDSIGDAVADYLLHVEASLELENSKCTGGYLDPLTRKPVANVLQNVLIVNHCNTIIDAGLDDLLSGDRINDLKRMFELLQRVAMLDHLKLKLSLHIQDKCALIVGGPKQEKEQDANMIKSLLELKARMDAVAQKSFSSMDTFVHAAKEAFKVSINKRQNKPAELCAKFIDRLLKSTKGTSEQEIDLQLDGCFELFRLIQCKDVFEAFYGKDLARRLLLSKSASFDAERSMLSKLKIECGSDFTNKLEGMFKDMELSKDSMIAFMESAQAQKKMARFDFNVYVLTSAYWPAYSASKMILPKELLDCQSTFTDYYLTKHSGRILTWQNTLGSCSGEHELAVSLHQAIVLLLFNSSPKLNYKEIKTLTGIEDADLSRTLQSLACAKIRVLNKTPKGRDVNTNDIFEFNRSFTHSLKRITINQIQAQSVQDQVLTTEKVVEDRRWTIQACIVRILKTHKKIAYKELVGEIFGKLKFAIEVDDLKKYIESLIEQDYIERSPTDAQMLLYKA